MKKSFQTNEYFFHCVDDEGISLMCMSDEQTERNVAYAFLMDLKKTFYNKFTLLEIQKAKSYELEFADEIKKKMHFFNEKGIGFDTKSEEVLRDLQSVKDAMVENMEKLLDRDFKIDVALARAQDINQYSLTYRKRAKKYNQFQKRRKLWYTLIGIAVLAVIILAIVLIA
eukprot:CAMPEP_0197008730 /NCGR_PEP_ID=MMETSP1380-20130617/46698_1 /TAXON_ID=5936 /ORGANISM="Euplotes crassus, Strain CT5" /LENGTH=169 /DNA_ID=CAMNT_0042429511 /DNA_START=145 /DNA_END=655 /DNA_ORIENTATION=-